MRRRNLRRLATILFGVVLITWICFAANTFAAETVKVGGMGSALGIMKVLGGEFTKKNPGIRVEVLPSIGTSGGIKAVSDSALDIGVAGRPLKDEEKKPEIISREIAKSLFVFLTNGKQITGISTKELMDIYEGKTLAWPDGTRVRIILRPERESATLVIKNISPAMSRAIDSALTREGMIITATDQEALDLLEKMPGSFGATSMDQVITEKRKLNVLAFNGVKPSLKALSDGSYPLSKTLYFITPVKMSKATEKFVSFVLSSEGRRIFEQNGCLPLNVK